MIEVIIIFADIPGWIGAFFILLAFWLLTHKVVHSHSYTYMMLNLFGGILLAFDAWSHNTYAGFVLNLVWICIAVYGIGWAHKRKPVKLKR
jgi:formate hydrogenlyase subunit 3/multisubunit Na+/H+ antiporter MnhD subunit